MLCSSAVGLALLAIWVLSVSGKQQTKCHCKNLALCQPVIQNEQMKKDKEIFIFDNGGKDWKHYIWSNITTIIASQQYDPELLCHAHANGVQLFLRVTVPPVRTIWTKQKMSEWVNKQVKLVKTHQMDGINLHLDQVVVKYSPESQKITEAVQQIFTTFRKEISHSKVIVNVPWSPQCIYGRCYEYAKLNANSDRLLVMGYLMHTTNTDYCFAKPNSPYSEVSSGITEYINLGISPSKLVLGVPWFGVDYTCKKLHEEGGCELINKYDRKTCNAKDGDTIPYKTVMTLLPRALSQKFWGNGLQVPSFTYMSQGKSHEVWYDNPQSIAAKASLVKVFGLAGIGVWAGNFLNYSYNTTVAKQTQNMWNALKC
ncbi:di-N-acetylchitobiase-like [Hypanus sabinus]|uniref:di-N-acetylchitobiase-like n=1 Tax=Hypanus sabinus TaxID=79690 RepID=UPI0028C449B7|nr:di-N-acetylchitobiase-like [Hypanus sabinus]